NSLLGEFVARQATFYAMMDSLTHLVQTLSDIVIDDRPELEELLTNLRELATLLGKNDGMVRSILQTAPIAVRNLANITGTGNAIDFNAANGLLVDSWMCAISGRAKQIGMIEYYQDCK
ncbi:MAG TPA: mammalian cell entry protein, partial [Mycobacterium sp.]|nr:mammalian cell entry protein [Mycobacterium sp.]